jgi:hypothetical protein
VAPLPSLQALATKFLKMRKTENRTSGKLARRLVVQVVIHESAGFGSEPNTNILTKFEVLGLKIQLIPMALESFLCAGLQTNYCPTPVEVVLHGVLQGNLARLFRNCPSHTLWPPKPGSIQENPGS